VTSVAVTGIGLLTPLGDRVAAVHQAVCDGRCAVRPSTTVEGAGVACIEDFDASRYARVRGMRLFNRTTLLGLCAAKLALSDALLDAGALGSELGFVTASTTGHLDTLLAYDRSLVQNGLLRTNPALMALALPSAPGALIALSFGGRAFAVTLGGDASSLDALGTGARWVAAGRARACVVVAASAVCEELALSASRAGLLARAAEYRVFDRRGCGIAMAEAAVAVVLERTGDARERGVEPKAIVQGQASTFGAGADDCSGALRRACDQVLRGAGVAPAELRLVSAGANGSRDDDRMEARGLVATLGESGARTPAMAVKASLGEAGDAGGLLQAVLAIASVRSRSAAPIVNLEEPEVPGLAYVRRETRVEPGSALVTSVGRSGSCSALLLSVRP
jgi:3-oxoacyl-(acyl-carrier-protein) synthase